MCEHVCIPFFFSYTNDSILFYKLVCLVFYLTSYVGDYFLQISVDLPYL